MAAPLTASMPQFTQLGNNVSVFIEAIDPATGDPVDGVAVTRVELWADVQDAPGASGSTVVGPYMLVPGPNA